ncbi:hypothetical protein L1987_64559 [Smallanthus sonchifolius]|uniref:Uncharacterized protein n=1 Tax=Smallanthus sonchifolius TaxID=185202 RepID=A0ACB9BS19_9ASTR|nr:hypothetical protein L1987_64559 [Smallanthus sonchifolius]
MRDRCADKAIHQYQVEKLPRQNHRYEDHKHTPLNLPLTYPPPPSSSFLIQTNISSMAAVSMAMLALTHNTTLPPTNSFNPLTLKVSSSSKTKRLVVKSSMKENAVTALTAAVLTASMVVPEVAQAASGVTPSLNNFLLSIGAGGIVLGGILGAIIGVSNFDPVKRG